LIEHGLVEKGDQDQRTNYYEATASGEQLLTRRRQWEDQYVSNLQESLRQDTDQANVAPSSSD